ncbi:MAG TPA: metallophosphoesterase family protein [Candidatus Polarisedimenticolaceae bacterium]|nr:metallophosphoesterase family protein [Candidatus Polarisedimenticolaceae bacterium]
MSAVRRIGVISDTHGLMRPAALRELAGVEQIVHAGDVGTMDVLEALRRIAPVVAVRGNVDTAPGCRELPPTAELRLGGAAVLVLHVLDELDLDPAAAGYAAVIYGHTHEPSIRRRRGVLYLNPGSAGPRRFRLPISLALLEIGVGGGVEARLVALTDPTT